MNISFILTSERSVISDRSLICVIVSFSLTEALRERSFRLNFEFVLNTNFFRSSSFESGKYFAESIRLSSFISRYEKSRVSVFRILISRTGESEFLFSSILTDPFSISMLSAVIPQSNTEVVVSSSGLSDDRK